MRIAIVDTRLRHPYDVAVHSIARIVPLIAVLHSLDWEVNLVRLQETTWSDCESVAKSSDIVLLWVLPETLLNSLRAARGLLSIVQRPAIWAFGPMAEFLDVAWPAEVASSLDRILLGDPEAAFLHGPASLHHEVNLDSLPLPPMTPSGEWAPGCMGLPPGRHVIEMQSSRGCPGRCTFCVTGSKRESSRWRGMSWKRVLDEVDAHRQRRRVKHVRFDDDSFLADSERAVRILEGLSERGLSSSVTARVVDLLKHNLKQLAQLGCSQVEIGIEHTHLAVLRRYGKPHTAKQGFDVAEALAELGVDVRIALIPFDPWTSMEELRHLSESLIDKPLSSRIESSPVHRLAIIPGTTLWRSTLGGEKPVDAGYFHDPTVNGIYQFLLRTIPSRSEILDWSRHLRSKNDAQGRALLAYLPHQVLFYTALGLDTRWATDILGDLRERCTIPRCSSSKSRT